VLNDLFGQLDSYLGQQAAVDVAVWSRHVSHQLTEWCDVQIKMDRWMDKERVKLKRTKKEN